MLHPPALAVSLPTLLVLGLGLVVPPAHADECALLPRRDMHVRLTLPEAHAVAASAIKSIVNHTWGPEGVRFTWLEGRVRPDAWRGVDVWIAAVRGMPVRRDGGVLGLLWFNAGAPRRMIRLSIDAAAAWVLPQPARWLHASPRTLARLVWDPRAQVPRALGRAAAHEVGHFLLGSAAHARTGVMRASYDRPGRLLDSSGAWRLDHLNRRRLRARLLDGAECP